MAIWRGQADGYFFTSGRDGYHESTEVSPVTKTVGRVNYVMQAETVGGLFYVTSAYTNRGKLQHAGATCTADRDALCSRDNVRLVLYRHCGSNHIPRVAVALLSPAIPHVRQGQRCDPAD